MLKKNLALFLFLIITNKVDSEITKKFISIGVVSAQRSEDIFTIQIFNQEHFILLKEMTNTVLVLVNAKQEIEYCLKPIHFFEYDFGLYVHSITIKCKNFAEEKRKIQLGDLVFIETSMLISTKKTETKREHREKILIHPVDFKEMIYIESDYFLYGQGKDSEDPSYNLYFYHWNLENIPRISSFYIDKYEVTNYEFLMFCKRTNYKCPKFLYHLLEEEKDLPFIYATYKDVEEYAKWSKKQIPTEWEWEFAAKGGLNVYLNSSKIMALDLFDAYPSSIENCNTLEMWKEEPRPISVYELKDANFYGIVGMCGNALEWTSSYFMPYPGNRFKNDIFSGKFFRVLKGGAFFLPNEYAKVYKRIIGGAPLFYKDPVAGFRLILRTR